MQCEKTIKNKLKRLVENLKDENLFIKLYDAQPVSAKVGFFAALVISMLTHFILYSNFILEFHEPGFFIITDQLHAGRWFHNFVNRLTFNYMNWVTGLMHAIFLSLTVFVTIKTFNIKNRLYAVLIAGIMVAFPTVAESSQYFDGAAPYFLAALLSISAVYVTKLYKFGWIAGSIFIMLSLACYQAQVALAMIGSLMVIIMYILQEKPSFLELVKYALRFLLLIVGGLAAYYISLQVLQVPAVYQGMGDLSLAGIPSNILRVYREVFQYFFTAEFRIGSRYVTVAYGIVALMSFALFIIAIRKSLGKNIQNIIIVTAFILLLPLAANFTRLLSYEYPSFIKTMSYAYCFLLVIPLILLDNIKIKTYGLNNVLSIALASVIVFNVSFSNFIYLRGQVATMHAMNVANRVSAHVEQLLPYSENNQLFINGSLRNNPIFPTTELFNEYTPRTVSFVAFGNYDHFLAGFPWNLSENIIRYRIGLDINPISPFATYRMQYLLDEAITKGMPVYPQEGSVELIDGVVVVMLNFSGRIDIEETTQNSVTATIRHLGTSTDLEFEYIWYMHKDGEMPERIQTASNNIIELDHTFTQPGAYYFKAYISLPDGTQVTEVYSRFIFIE